MEWSKPQSQRYTLYFLECEDQVCREVGGEKAENEDWGCTEKGLGRQPRELGCYLAYLGSHGRHRAGD